MVQNVFDVKLHQPDLSGLLIMYRFHLLQLWSLDFHRFLFLDYLDVKICFSKFLQDDFINCKPLSFESPRL